MIREIPAEYRAGLIGLGALTLLLLASWVRERRRSVRAEREALVDSLTGVASRQALHKRLALEWKRAVRYQRPLGLLLLDLDDLKQVNDELGHAAGDEILRRAGTSISERVRESDTVARLGGDEFVVVCPETPQLGLEQLASALKHDFARLPVGISVGLAEREPRDETPADLMARADAAMYREKRAASRISAPRA